MQKKLGVTLFNPGISNFIELLSIKCCLESLRCLENQQFLMKMRTYLKLIIHFHRLVFISPGFWKVWYLKVF